MSTYLNQIQSFFNHPFFDFSLLGNTFLNYFQFISVFIFLSIIFRVFQSIILAKLNKVAERTKTDFDDVLIETFKTIKPSFYIFIAFYISLLFLNITSITHQVLDVVLIIWITFQIIIIAQKIIDYIISKTIQKENERDAKTAIQSLNIIIKIILWIIGLLLILSNLGINITSLVAGLGIGGIAIALALQNILSDLFSSFAIYFDKPFKVGDFIIIGKDMGTVEQIGIKTTRLRALQGEQIVISNQELTSARIQNFKKLSERRVAFELGVVYGTPDDKMKKIPELIEKIIKETKDTRFDRSHFKSFGDFALIFETVYYITSGEYLDYMNAQQEIGLKIKEKFSTEEIEFAYPTQTLFLNK